MAGHMIAHYLEANQNLEVWRLSRKNIRHQRFLELDITDIKRLEKALSSERFDVVINCVGLLNSFAEKNPDTAIWINSFFPHYLSILGNKISFKVIHLSTDCVFSGKGGGYEEDSAHDGVGFYARSKSLGEVINKKDLTFRTSIIGPELKEDGIGLFHWFMKQNTQVKGYSKVYWSGVTTLELAKAIEAALFQDLTGLHHLVNNDKISKYELLNLFNRYFRKNRIEILPEKAYVSDKSMIRTRNTFDYRVPTYSQMIEELKEYMNKNSTIYNQYLHP